MNNQLSAISLQIDFLNGGDFFFFKFFLLCSTLEEAKIRRRKNGRHKIGANTTFHIHTCNPSLNAHSLAYGEEGENRYRYFEEIRKKQDNTEPQKTREKGNFKR